MNLTPSHRNVHLRHYRLAGLIMTLTFDLWTWKPFQQCPLTWCMFVTSCVEIPPLNTETSRHVN